MDHMPLRKVQPRWAARLRKPGCVLASHGPARACGRALRMAVLRVWLVEKALSTA